MGVFSKLTAGTVSITCAILIASAAHADSRAVVVSVVNQWYGALSPGNDAAAMKEKIGGLLADPADIMLEDLGVSQTRAEFLDSLDNWADAIKGGYIAHAIEEASSEEVSTLVCYNFGDSEMMVREVMSFSGDKITKSVQAKSADSCDEF